MQRSVSSHQICKRRESDRAAKGFAKLLETGLARGKQGVSSRIDCKTQKLDPVHHSPYATSRDTRGWMPVVSPRKSNDFAQPEDSERQGGFVRKRVEVPPRVTFTGFAGKHRDRR